MTGGGGGGHRSALVTTLIETARFSGVDPHAFLAHVFDRLPSATSADLYAPMPGGFEASSTADVVFG